MSSRTGSVVVVVGAVVVVVSTDVVWGAATVDVGDRTGTAVDAGEAVDPLLPQATTGAMNKVTASALMQ
jgi:hypothetical protein